MDIIQDGTGSGNKAKVDNQHRIHTKSINTTLEHDINVRDGLAFHLLFEQTPTGANDCFLYLKNEYLNKDIIIEGFDYRVASPERIQIYLDNSGIPSGGSIISPANNKAGESNTPLGTFQAGNNITGLTQGTKVHDLYLTSIETKHYNFEQDIIIPSNQTFAIYTVTGGIQISGNIIFHYSDSNE